MTPEQVAGRVRDLLGPVARVADAYGETVADVPREEWVGTVTAVRDDAALALVLFDLLTAVDEEPHGLDVVLRLWSPGGRHGLLLRTRCPRDDARVPSLTGVFAGADWHERHAAEMFDLVFEGHPGLVPLLLPGGFAGAPLRKDFVLASRVVKPWPGAPEPGQSTAEAAEPTRRRRTLPPGVPAPGTWPAPAGGDGA